MRQLQLALFLCKKFVLNYDLSMRRRNSKPVILSETAGEVEESNDKILRLRLHFAQDDNMGDCAKLQSFRVL